MKKITYSYPKSSFLSTEKDMGLIVDMVMKNERLKKMLFYTTRDCLTKPNLTKDQTLDLFGKHIKIVPKLYIDQDVVNYLYITFNNFAVNPTNPEFRDNLIIFDIVCHYDQWNMKDFELRPYKIAAEIDSMFNDKRLTGIGTLQFVAGGLEQYSDEFHGICLVYRAVHGDEDKKNMPNPMDNSAMEENFNNIFNPDHEAWVKGEKWIPDQS